MFVIYYYRKTPYLTVELRPPVFMKNTLITDNTNTPSNTEEAQEEMHNHDNSVSNLDKELPSVFNKFTKRRVWRKTWNR